MFFIKSISTSSVLALVTILSMAFQDFILQTDSSNSFLNLFILL